MTYVNNKKKIDWGNVPQWVAIALTIFGTGAGGAGGWIWSNKQNKQEIQELKASVVSLEQRKQNLDQQKQNLDQQKQNLDQQKQNLDQQKQNLDQQKQKLYSEIENLKSSNKKLTDELEKAKEELAKPIVIDISDYQRPYEFILNIKLKPRNFHASNNFEMTLEKLIIEKGLGMILVFSTLNKYPQGSSLYSKPSHNSTLMDDLGNEYFLRNTVGPSTIEGGVKAEHKLIFQLPKADANKLNAKISGNGIFYLPPFTINLPEEVKSKLREN